MSNATEDLQSIQQEIVGGRFNEALTRLEPLLEREPDNTEALYMSAVCQRYLGHHQSALTAVDRLKRLSPGLGRAHQEEGHTLKAMGRLSEALAAYGRAAFFNPALEASLRSQLELLDRLNLSERRQAVQTQLDHLQALPKPLVAVLDLMAQNKLLKAEDLCRQFLRKQPLNVEAMRLLAEIGLRLGVMDDAEYLLESAVEVEPNNSEVRIDYIKALRKRQKYFQALAEAEKLLDSDPANPRFQSIFAVECMQTGDYNKALDYFDRILEKLPGDPVTLTSKGHALRTRGDYEQAVESYLSALDHHPFHGEAYYSLANLKTYRFSAEEIARMRQLQDNSNLSHADQVFLFFALGKACEDLENYDESFAFYARGNQLKRAQSRYAADSMSEEMAAQRKVCTAELFDAHRRTGCQAPDPIFILGLPRAGSTLLEQILSSHSLVDGTLELPNILSLSQRLRRRTQTGSDLSYPEILRELDADTLTEFGEEYLHDTRVHRQDAPFFIDKMPNNFRHIGLIKLILPNAKIIDARRNPMACCFSGYKQLFAEGQEFSYDLTDIGTYYRDYVDLMAHWKRVLPGFVLQVNNEDLIADFEHQVRRMLDFCGLPFEESCLRYFETRRNIRTPSSEQVRRPISTGGVDHWRHFSNHLAPLRAALGPLADYADPGAATSVAQSETPAETIS